MGKLTASFTLDREYRPHRNLLKCRHSTWRAQVGGASDAWVAVVSRRDLGSINIAELSLYAGILADGKLFGGLLPHAAGGAQVPLAILQLLDPGEEPQTVCVSQNARIVVMAVRRPSEGAILAQSWRGAPSNVMGLPEDDAESSMSSDRSAAFSHLAPHASQ